jgi:hypothetical protein
MSQMASVRVTWFEQYVRSTATARGPALAALDETVDRRRPEQPIMDATSFAATRRWQRWLTR